jgi:predicted nucleic acid-binding protein
VVADLLVHHITGPEQTTNARASANGRLPVWVSLRPSRKNAAKAANVVRTSAIAGEAATSSSSGSATGGKVVHRADELISHLLDGLRQRDGDQRDGDQRDGEPPLAPLEQNITGGGGTVVIIGAEHEADARQHRTPPWRDEALAMRGAHAIGDTSEDAGPSPAACEPIIMGVAARARTDKHEQLLPRMLSQFDLLRLDTASDLDGAARIYRTQRRAGVTPRGMIVAVARRPALTTRSGGVMARQGEPTRSERRPTVEFSPG